MTTAVRAEGLTRRFGDFTAVDSVSLEVEEGEIFGFLGPNGAGKTTTIKMLIGLLEPTEGEATVKGMDVRKDREKLRKNVGYMSQKFSLYRDLTVDENIEFFCRLYSVDPDRREERRAWVLETAGLEERTDALTGDLPLGYKQRLAAGCAVLHEPPILFLDEPTSGVDPSTRRGFWDLIRGLSAEGTTTFVTTHYMQEAEYCDRLGLMNRGRLIALDRPERLREQHDEVVLAVECADGAAAVGRLAALEPVTEASLFGRRVHVMTDDADAGERAVRRALREAGIELSGIRRIEPSLEEVFASLVRRAGGAPSG